MLSNHKITNFTLRTRGVVQRQIKSILKRIEHSLMATQFLGFHSLLNDTIKSRCLLEHDGQPLDVQNVPLGDQLYLYKQMWFMDLQFLYNYFLPGTDYYGSDLGPEITPYAVMLCKMNPLDSDPEQLFEKIFSGLPTTFDEFCKHPVETCKEAGVDIGPVLELPVNVCPEDSLEQIALFLRLANLPPLTAIANFFIRAYIEMESFFNFMAPFCQPPSSQLSAIQSPEPLFWTTIPTPFDVYSKHDIVQLAQHPHLNKFKDQLLKIHALADEIDLEVEGHFVCSSCTEESDRIKLPREFAEWCIITKNRKISEAIAYALGDTIKSFFLEKTYNAVISVMTGSQQPEHAKAFVLVEGATDSNALQVVAWKLGTSLWSFGITIVDCMGKEQVLKLFKGLKTNFPQKPIVCLLDSDAKAEQDVITQMIGHDKNKYRSFLIPTGSIEDLFPLHYSVEAINQIYFDRGDAIEISDFNPEISFLKNMKLIFYQKKQTTFSAKPHFGRMVAMLTPVDELPDLLIKVIQTTLSLTKAAAPAKLDESVLNILNRTFDT